MDARDKIIEDLQKLVARQSEQIARLTVRVAELELALAKAKKDSSTSSKPPSSDITKPKTSKKPGRRGKPKRGGQPGHQQHLRAHLPPERVDETFETYMEDVLQVPVSQGYLAKLPDEKTKVWAEQLEDRSRRLFQAWHTRETMTAEGFRRSMMIHRDRFLDVVRNPPSTKEANNLAARFAANRITDSIPQFLPSKQAVNRCLFSPFPK